MRIFEVIEGGGQQPLLTRPVESEPIFIRDREITQALNSFRGQALIETVAFKIGLIEPEQDSEADFNHLGELLQEAAIVRAYTNSSDERRVTIEGNELNLRDMPDEDRVRLMMRSEWLRESHDDMIEEFVDTPLLEALREIHYESDGMYTQVTKEALELAHIAVLIEHQKI